MGSSKWIGGVIGFMAFGPLGALAGFVFGSLFDSADVLVQENGNTGRRINTDYSEDVQGERFSFLFSMLVMASYIIKADGKVMHSEMNAVRGFLRSNFGPLSVKEGEQILLKLFDLRKKMDAQNPGAFKNTIQESGAQIATNMSYEQRLQLLSFLAHLTKVDGLLAPEEISALKEVALAMHLTEAEAMSALNLGSNTLEGAYKVLEISSTATDEEVRKAYKNMILKHHPDKVATLGEDVKRAAEVKIQEINAAKDLIFKARGLK